ncbi:hypothetical protein F5878DRAFT_639614 [Lentinula raphanica]|uniref:Uncharacterized protein n=1 Tax=Lentinula raphanica TaxID=153919 RepID=A0AA38UHM8_9AGAR|nr:hypothetical protein F5878DRAFT_639614 [Lentinula raphanica]
MEIPILQLSCHLLPLLFPTSCPYVRYCRWGTKHVPEVAIDFSGGGFSKYFSRPAYQDTAVAAFFETFPNGIFALGSFNPQNHEFSLITPSNGRIVTHQIAQLSQMLRPRLTISKWSLAARPGSSAKHPRLKLHLSQALGHIRLRSAISGFTDITSGNAPGCSGLTDSTYIFFLLGVQSEGNGWLGSWEDELVGDSCLLTARERGRDKERQYVVLSSKLQSEKVT